MNRQPPSRKCVTTAVVVLTSLSAYLALLAWDQQETLGADGYLHGPYEPWQVAALCIVVALAASWAGWREDPVVGAATATMSVTVAFVINAAMDTDSDGLWPVGAAGVAMATLVGSLICARLGAWLRHRT